MSIYEQTDWYKKIVGAEYIYIFGAGEAAVESINCIDNCVDRKIDGIIVSDTKENPTSVSGYPVFALDDDSLSREGLVIMSTGMNNNEIISEILKKAGFNDIIPSASQMRFVEKEGNIDELTVKENTNKHLPVIYIVTSHLNQHNKAIDYNLETGEYIQAGAALTDIRVCPTLDNTGDNISDENPYFCELSAGYWIAKNDNKHDWLGLFHYSRGLDLNDKDIEAIVNSDVEVVLPWAMEFSQQMVSRVNRKSYEVLTQALNDDDLAEYNKYLLGNEFYCGNILFAKAEIFKDYYNWMMEILRKCESYMSRNHIPISKRLWGYYGEHLTNLYFRKNSFKVVHTNLNRFNG